MEVIESIVPFGLLDSFDATIAYKHHNALDISVDFYANLVPFTPISAMNIKTLLLDQLCRYHVP